MSKKIILTGDRPTGRLHLGHFVGSLQNRVKLQDDYRQFIMIADIQALTDNAKNPQKVIDNISEVTLDYLATGIDPDKTTIFVQSLIPELAELTVYFMNLVTLARLQRNPTVKDEMKQKGFGANVPVGFLVYPISQAADILAFKADLVPVGEDQLPMIEQTNEIVRSFNRIYGQTFKSVSPLLPEYGKRLSGIDGKTKASKSLDNAIFLSDTDKEIDSKVKMMFTDPNHLHIEDPGKIEGNIVFEYLNAFDSDKSFVKDLEKRYQKGGVGDGETKKRLSKVLKDLIGPIRNRREKLAQESSVVMDILYQGSKAARKVAQMTLMDVKKAIGMMPDN